MKLSESYPNYTKGLMDLIHDKPIMDKSDDKMKIIHQLPLRTSKKAFDYYELNKLNNGSVYFEIVTMNGFKTIVRTRTEIIERDLSREEWFDLISRKALEHLSKEEYRAFLNGYVKQGKGGCSILLSLFLIFSCLLLSQTFR
ncbi:hypothetical protein DZC72_04285 [Maribacter algicola]|uniref:Uncharacterized protein n=1 Tax=Maribacter algicola TaxID=2498892 RepID=A0A426RLJ9_9FLAO|nr:hypothetical protein [Maribacter algicola]RRQ49814.1 hypothetical protein DZC72_04285 [Maribacter algicola]